MTEEQWLKAYNDLLTKYGAVKNIPPMEFAQLAAQSPANIRRQQEELMSGKQASALGISSDIADFLSQASQLGVSLNQLAESKRMADRLQRPSIPELPTLNPALTQQLYNAATARPEAVLAPARDEIQAGYLNTLEAARQGTGGQAGAFQAMANLANIERMRAANQLVPLAQDVRLQNQQNFNNLLGQRMQEQQALQQARQFNAGMAFDQYGQDAAAVAGMRGNALGNVLQSSQGFGQAVASMSPYFVGLDDESKAYAEKVFNNVNSAQARMLRSQPSTFRNPAEDSSQAIGRFTYQDPRSRGLAPRSYFPTIRPLI